MQQATVVVGGGIAGLMSAALLAEAGEGPVLLLERAPQVGGLLASPVHGEAGRFDRGTHTLAQTGIAALDAWLLACEPEGGWVPLEGNRRDLAGAYLQGRLQSGSPYPDLRAWPKAKREAYLGALMAQLGALESPSEAGAGPWLAARLGEALAQEVLNPLLEHAFLLPAEALARPLATALVPTERVVALDFEAWALANEAPALRARLACPEQTQLPAALSSGRSSFYPRRGGMGAWVAAWAARLESLGVQLWCGAELQGLALEGQSLKALHGQKAGEAFCLEAPRQVVWSSGPFTLAPLLGLDPRSMGGDAPLQTVLVHWRLDRPPGLGELYYAFVMGGPGRGYRYTNYAAYAPDAVDDSGWPLTLELLLPPGPKPGPELLVEAEAQARALGAIPAEAVVRHAVLEALPGGFPRPSLANLAVAEALRGAIAEKAPSNLSLVGLGSEPGLFFQNEVLKQVWRRFGPIGPGSG